MTVPEDRGLQGMRGFSSLAVVFYHFTIPTFVAAALCGWGWAGVLFFFVLSGYILGKKYLNGDYHEAKPDGTKRFAAFRYYARRFFRIWPLYWLTLPLFILLTSLPWIWQDVGMLQYSFFNPSWNSFPLSPSWTLVIEEVFYLTLPFWVLAFRWNWKVSLAATLLVSAVAQVWMTYQLPAVMFCYGLGLVGAMGHEVRLPSKLVYPLGAGTLGGAGLLGYVGVYHGLMYVPLSFVFYLLVVNLRSDRLFTNQWAVFIGALTYPIYLLGLPLKQVVIDLGASSPWWMVVLLSTPFILAVSWLVHRWVERPAIGLGRKLESWHYRRRAETWEIAE